VSTAYTIYKSETILQNTCQETTDILDEVNASLLLADELNAVLDDGEVPIVDYCCSRGSGSFNSGSGNGDLHLGGIESCLSDTDTAPINNRSPRKSKSSAAKYSAANNNNSPNNRNRTHPLKKIDLTKMMAPHTNHSPNNSKDLLPEITKIIASAKDTPSKVKTHVTSTVDNTKKSIVNSVKSKRDEVVNGVKNSLSCGGNLNAVQGCTSTSIDDDELNAILNNTAEDDFVTTPDTSINDRTNKFNNNSSPTDVNNIHNNNKAKDVNMYNIVKTSNLFTKCYTPGSESYDDMVYTSFGGVPSTDEFSPDRSSNSGVGGEKGIGEESMEEITTALFPNESHLVSIGNSVTAGHVSSGISVDNNTAASSSGSMAAADNSKALFPGDNAVVSGSLKSTTPPEGSPSNSVNSATKDLLSSINSVASSNKATPVVVSSTKKKKVVNRSLNHNSDGSADLLPEITAMINTVNETPRKIKNHVTAQVDKTKSNINARVDKTKCALGIAKQNALDKVTCGNLETVNEVGQVAKFACSAGVLVKKNSSTNVNDSFSSLNEILEEEEMTPTAILRASPIKDQDSFILEEVVTSKQQFDARTTTTIAAQASNLQDEIYDYASSTSAPVKVIDGIFHVADPDGSSYPTEESSGTTTTSGIVDKASDNSTAASFPFRKKGYTIQATHPSSPDDTSIDISAYTESTRNTDVASVHLNPLCTRHANDCCFLNSMLEDEHQARVSRLLNLTERYLECNNKEEEKGVPPIVGVGTMINEDTPLKKEKEKQVLGNISEDKENKKEEAPTFSADWLNDSTVWDHVGTNVFSE